jgi:hypothetical protein
VAQSKNWHLEVILLLSSKIQKVNLTIPASCEVFWLRNVSVLSDAVVIFVFSILELTATGYFGVAFSELYFVTVFLVDFISHARYAYFLSGPYKDMLKCLLHISLFHRAFLFTIFICSNKCIFFIITPILVSIIKAFKTLKNSYMFRSQLIIFRESPGLC